MIRYIDDNHFGDRRVLMRVDFNVSLNPDHTISNDERIKKAIPTIRYLLEHGNRLVLMSHLGRPKGERNPDLSMRVVADKLREYLPEKNIVLIDNFMQEPEERFVNQDHNDVFILENIRYYPEEKKHDEGFAQKLAQLGEVFVNDAFGVCHRADASVVGVTKFMDSYGGLLLKKEVEMIKKVVESPERPVVAILGGAKISSKINLIDKLTEIADYLILGGGIANTFLSAQGYEIGKSISEYEEIENARRLLFTAVQKDTHIMFPSDAIISKSTEDNDPNEVVSIDKVTKDGYILDIGPQTQAQFGATIAQAKTIIWNGPVGLFEKQAYRRGTDFIYYSIAQNEGAVSVVGGGDTLSAISKKEYLEKITHISTGGGAMLEFIEKETLPGIEALK
jgi:phosphoglycerate kinase